MVFQIKEHELEAVLAGEPNASGDGGVLTAILCPIEEGLTGGKDHGRGYDRLDHICTIEAGLIVDCAIRQGDGQQSTLSNLIVKQGWCPIEGHGYIDWGSICEVKENCEITGDTDVGAAIN